ncbi:hypothetical protein [Oceanisphaera psychrotolerans]|uniref:Uncharacterized protein n=1 Tax=Oceanisphaera psychrotolerans TaxID=1414654 RepID=A0A1J4QEY4_9GAMM|nr:hypothetical protein [Oceanisphaera psychrotolerans]OIN09104.1 hypothetical protein BFR47_02170 [Oceanisphaera psychrotolerans]
MNEAQHVLRWQTFDAKAMMWLRIISLVLAMAVSICFLYKGLKYTDLAITSVVGHASQKESSAVVIASAKAQEANISPANETQASARSKASTDSKGTEENKTEKNEWDKALISSGSIITLIAFVLGVGLTLILAVLKLSISANKPNEPASDYVGLAGPFSELLTQFANWLKSKGK